MGRSLAVAISAIFLGMCLYASDDPFIGYWIYNAKKSPLPVVHFKCEDVGQNGYRLTFLDSEPITLPLDGSAHRSPDSDAMLSLKQVNDHTWEYTETKSNKNVSTFTVTGDKMTWHKVLDQPDGEKTAFDLSFHRLGSGKSFVGDWTSDNESFSLNQTKPQEMIIKRFGPDGLSFTWPDQKERTDLRFDGKPYPDQGPNVDKGQTSTGKRLDAHTIQIITKHADRVDSIVEMKISADGLTLTDTQRPEKGTTFVSIFDRK